MAWTRETVMNRVDLRLSSAVAVGKLAGLASRQLGLGGGTSLPGILAARLDADVLGKLARGLPRGAVLVTGTNGKTTTSRLLAARPATALTGVSDHYGGSRRVGSQACPPGESYVTTGFRCIVMKVI